MPRRYFKRRYTYNKDKYSVEQSAGVITTDNTNGLATVVPSADLQGMRKVKHITVSMSHNNTASNDSNTLYWALVYVPAGTSPNTLTLTGTNLYEPNQFVMNAGVLDFDAGPVRISSPVSRNLNSGDQIALIVKTPDDGNNQYRYVVRYAITLQ